MFFIITFYFKKPILKAKSTTNAFCEFFQRTMSILFDFNFYNFEKVFDVFLLIEMNKE